MVYKVIGLMSGSSLDGLDIVFVEIEEKGGKWAYQVLNAACLPFEEDLQQQLQLAPTLSAKDLALLDANFGRYIGQQVNSFISAHQLQYKVGLIVSHGHTVFHHPPHFTTQIGNGACIAAETSLPVVSDLRVMDVAMGGQGAPIVPMGELLLYPGYTYLVEGLLDQLNAQEYYWQTFPKSLANEFGTEVLLPLIKSFKLDIRDALCTYVEHVAMQISEAIQQINRKRGFTPAIEKILVTGGGAMNTFLVERLSVYLEPLNIHIEVPDRQTVEYKEAIVMALLGVLRWREEPTVLHTVTGAKEQSIGGALWMGK